ncbi:hypothetical protein C0Q64_23590 [Streptomyces albidoflavus]|uniref:TIR domain-containing protein n=1 Tax=Streptomyces albidoflavus TaxID=1886 RepID=UPI00101E7F7D|nr:TIR domain-containing protein [Streptomyces albidoflavus]RZD93271.1 hypothetical protein C0Q64_23590 [Streptomyces albidoflavus]RZD97723.1 hypothetical protein C0Q65_23815 [Streptomyces albidoflavus]
MKIFLNWSGDRSRRTAEALRAWLPDVLQYVKPWHSSLDISAGKRGVREITDELSKVNFGILCITPENQSSPWVNYEAGSIAREVDCGYVVPFLIGMKTTDLISPLSQFQAISGNDEDEVRKLISDINTLAGSSAISDETLERAFQRGWPEFCGRMKSISSRQSKDGSPDRAERSGAEMTEEILLIARQLDRRMVELERHALRVDGNPGRPSRESRRISEDRFLASSFSKIGWEVVRSSWEGGSVFVVAQSSGGSDQEISRDLVERIAKSLGRDVIVLGEAGDVMVRSALT